MRPRRMTAPVDEAAHHEGPWIVRPKKAVETPVAAGPQATTTVRSVRAPVSLAHTAAAHDGLQTIDGAMAKADEDARRRTSRRWLAAALMLPVYVAGAAGLWSTYRSFETPVASLQPTPARNVEVPTLPPIDDEIELRDALLDGPIRPKLRPAIDEDLAASDHQRPI